MQGDNITRIIPIHPTIAQVQDDRTPTDPSNTFDRHTGERRFTTACLPSSGAPRDGPPAGLLHHNIGFDGCKYLRIGVIRAFNEGRVGCVSDIYQARRRVLIRADTGQPRAATEIAPQ